MRTQYTAQAMEVHAQDKLILIGLLLSYIQYIQGVMGLCTPRIGVYGTQREANRS